MTLTDQQLSMLRHMLGMTDPYQREPTEYRNYAAVNPGDPLFVELEALGLVERYEARCPGTSYDWYRCTEAGKVAARRSFLRVRLPKRKRVYRRYLSVRECIPDLTFIGFLTDVEFAEIRREA